MYIFCSTRKLEILGNIVENGCIKPDPERVRPLDNLPVPADAKSLKQVIGLFAHYSKSNWIPKFSDRVAPLNCVKSFPLTKVPENAFHELKMAVKNSVVVSIDEN